MAYPAPKSVESASKLRGEWREGGYPTGTAPRAQREETSRRGSRHPTKKNKPSIALVYDWLTNMGGGEKLLLALHKAYPDAPIYTSVFIPENCPPFAGLDIRTTYLQNLPKFLRRRHQLFPVLRAHAFRTLDLSKYDIVLSSASAEAKAVQARHDAAHICYCHTPTRYYWSHYKEYKKDPGFGRLNPLIRLVIPPFVAWMRKLDLKAVAGVDYFIANSHAVQARIKKYYKHDSSVIFPPVQIERLQPKQPVAKADFYLVVGRQNSYKRTDIAIKACNQLKKRLIVIGKGDEHNNLLKLAGPTIEFMTNVDDKAVIAYFQQAKAFIFPQQDDFGITAVEAMAAGTPVIAYKKDGALDSVVDGTTGLFFAEQTTKSLVEAIKRFETLTFSTTVLQKHAEQFSEERFIEQIHEFVEAHTKTAI
ncbi:MAG TPA: glycosyltransferase [Patescibacteria group bacterium]|jgi:glycosyltransferase involved in cell wall biosynthesis|nr:glycosyltransferase [Patescibacteria group bacterium]